MKLTGLAVDNLDLLHEIDTAPEGATARSIAEKLGRDESNLSKTIKRLRDDALIGEGVTLTDAGRTITRVLAADGEVLADDATLLLRHSLLDPDPDNARTSYDDAALDELMHSIVQRTRGGRVGLKHALSVAPTPDGRWLMHGGSRRWRAIGRGIERGLIDIGAGIPCTRWDELSSLSVAIDAIVENVQREDLHPLDEGLAYARLIRQFAMSADAIAAAVHKSKKHVADRIAIVEKLDDEAKRRMRLAADDPDHLRYADARKQMQAQNAKPKPAVDVDAKEALVLIEIFHRVGARASSHPLAHGNEGWTRIADVPADSLAASALQQKGLIEFRDCTGDVVGPLKAFVRVTPDKATAVEHWIIDQGPGPMTLWNARVAVVGQGVVGELEQAGRYATPWLNDPLPEPEPASAPPALAPAPAALPVAERQAHLGPLEGGVSAQVPAEPGSDPLDPDIPPFLAKLAGVPEQPKLDAPDVDLTAAEQTILADVASKIAAAPLAGRADPKTGQPAFVGCAVGEYYKDPKAIRLVTELKLLAFVPSAKDVQMAVFTPRGKAWLAANAAILGTSAPYATAWLNPAPPPSKTGEGDRPAQPEGGGAAAARTDAATTYFAKPVVQITGFICGNCEETFAPPTAIEREELVASARFDDGDDVVEAEVHFPADAEGATCPHCQQPVRLLMAEVYAISSNPTA